MRQTVVCASTRADGQVSNVDSHCGYTSPGDKAGVMSSTDEEKKWMKTETNWKNA